MEVVELAELFLAEIVERRDFGVATELVFRVPPTFRPSPGQFVHLRCGDGGRILRRPYTVFSYGKETASVLVREAGSGSAWLRERRAGDLLDVLGPLGRGFETEDKTDSVMIAGGAGIAPFPLLSRVIRERGGGTVILWGMEYGEEFGDLPDLLAVETELRVATRDGSRGCEGTVLDLAREEGLTEDVAIYACGPRAMLLALVDSLDEAGRSSLQVSMEERMACGLGACRGCAVPEAGGSGYLTACRDGPVFRGEELDWERMRKSI